LVRRGGRQRGLISHWGEQKLFSYRNTARSVRQTVASKSGGGRGTETVRGKGNGHSKNRHAGWLREGETGWRRQAAGRFMVEELLGGVAERKVVATQDSRLGGTPKRLASEGMKTKKRMLYTS